MNAKRITLALLVFGAWLLAAPQALAAPPPAPAWQLSVTAMPTNFAPGAKNAATGGPEYFLIATNVGGAPTSGPIVLKATLPSDVTPLAAGGTDGDPESPDPICAPPAGQEISCETTGPLHPGRWLGARITADVASDAEGALVAKASISGGGAGEATASAIGEASPEAPSFDFLPGASGLDAIFANPDGSATTQAGSHPGQLTINFGFPVDKVEGILVPAAHLHDLRADLPRGVIGNPTATPVLCTEAELISELNFPKCPAASQVGTVSDMTIVGGSSYGPTPLYNMVPPPGSPALLGFDAETVGIFIHIEPEVRSEGDYGISATARDILAFPNNPIMSVQAQIWGDPASESHDQIRGKCVNPGGPCPVEAQKTAFLTMPSACAESITTGAGVDSWEELGLVHEQSVKSHDLQGDPVGVEGCNALAFEPTIEAQPTTNLIDSPSGLDFHLHQPQSFDLEGLSTAALKDALVALPEGMAANPSQADGLDVCSAQQIGLKTPIGQVPIHFNNKPASCPDAAKIGKVEVASPLLAQIDETANKVLRDPEGQTIPRVIEGSLYVAKPFDNPFDTLLALYIVIDDKKSGVIAKLAGEVEPDPVTGQLRTRFIENPQLPLEDVHVHLFPGPRASLMTPPVCATHTTTTAMVPWSAPEGVEEAPSSSFETTAAPDGGSCPASASQAPHKPAFSAGAVSPQAGAYTPFATKFSRSDGSQRLKAANLILPPGLIGKLAGIPACPEDAIAAAQGRGGFGQGALEQASPSCPAQSQLGTVTASAGAGPTPFYTQGKVYLAGPYKGGPISFAIITPAVAGPFDLGVVVVRVAAYVNPTSAQVTLRSDLVPSILHGILLNLRSVAVRADRPSFTLNPTSCDEMAITGEAISVFEQSAPLFNRFQLGGCEALPFKPKVSLRLFGGTKRGDHPRLRTILTAKEGEANIARATGALPRSAFLDQSHIRTVCTRVQFAAEECPKGAVYGHVEATTPLLDEPLEGPIYLRSSSNKLPDMVAVLKGPPSRPVQIEGVARIDSIRGGIRANFDTVPDAPIKKVVITLQGGRKGLLINSTDLCAARHRATVKMDAHNGKAHDSRPVVKASCHRAKRKGGKRRG